MEKLSSKRIKIIHAGGRNVSSSAPSKPGAGLFGRLNFSKAQASGSKISVALGQPVLKSSRADIPKVDLAAVKSWVALEEKIVHSHVFDRMQELDGREIKTITRNVPKTEGPSVSRKGALFFGFLKFLNPAIPRKEIPSVPERSVMRNLEAGPAKADMEAVKSWVALEEKIVHDYKEQITIQPATPVLLPQISVKRSLPVPEIFGTQTTLSSSPSISESKEPLRRPEKKISKLERAFLVLGWLAVGVLVLFYLREASLSQEASRKSLQFRHENKQLEQSYAVLENVSKKQNAEVTWLNSQLQDLKLELRDARAEIATLRSTVQTQNAIVSALKAQSQALEKIIDQGGMSALSGAAAGVSQEQFVSGGNFLAHGAVTSINERRGFIVINMGAAQGARSGQWITVSRFGRGLAVGRIDRVYPTMSVAVLRNAGIGQTIQEGDSVFFS